MGKSQYWDFEEQKKMAKKRRGLNPIWRGIGCLLLSGLTVGGYFFAEWLISENEHQGWLAIPNSYYSPSFAPWLPEGMVIKLVVAFFFLIFSFGLLNLFYAIVSPRDEERVAPPPLKRTVRKRR
ncbi:MAG: hypothetical protein JXA25_14260 [Anaerolineales bacterium]|nr:hypothetical protein [Anaerolineales bacterium]